MSSPAVTYTSSNIDVATVNSSTGAVTIVGVGTTNITATYVSDSYFNDSSSFYTLLVEKGETTTTFPQSTYTASWSTGEFTSPKATVKSGSTSVTSPAVTYTSSNTSVATVDASTGAVTPKSEGTTTITAMYAGNSNYLTSTATYTLNVITTVSSLSFATPLRVISLVSATTLQLNPVISPSTVTKDKLTWKSSNTAIATVNGSGLVTAKKEGEVTITCECLKDTQGNKTSATCTVRVSHLPKVSSLSFDQPTQCLAMGTSTTLQLTPTVNPTSVTASQLDWSSSDESIATVDGSGKVTGIKRGTVNITCQGIRSSGDLLSATCKVIVSPYTLCESIKFNNTYRVLALGTSTTLELAPVITPRTIKKEQLYWSSSDPTVATVDKGVVTGLKEGLTTIHCKGVNAEGTTVAAACNVVVSRLAKVTSITLPESKYLIAMGTSTTLQLTPVINPTTVTASQLEWTSSDESIATVDGSGKVTGVKRGTVTVTCKGINSKNKEITASC